MIKWYKKVVFENYVNFKGRASRKEYWMFILLNMIISIPLNYILPVIAPNLVLLGSVYTLFVIIPSFAVGVRRMHDVGKSGWYIFFPIYNVILLCTEGECGINDYGSDPVSDTEEIDQIGNENY